MEPHGWRNWKELPYRGEAGSKYHKSNKLAKFSKFEKTVNFLSVAFLVLFSLSSIYLAIHNYLINNTDYTTAFAVLSIALVTLTIAVAQGVIATTRVKVRANKARRIRKTSKRNTKD